jgi:putative ABC transport system permease protein
MSDYTAAPFVAGLLGGLGLLALIVAVGGLYGVLLELGERRKRETAVRLALGANPGQLIRTVIREGMRPVLTGLVIGLLLGTAARALFAGAPFSLDASDPAAILLASVPLLLIALLACYLPARAAARVDPRVLLYEV